MTRFSHHLLIIFFTFHFIATTLRADDKAEVHVISGVPNTPTPLRVRCQSKDTDFGTHTLNTNEEFYWRFKPSVFGVTLYFCHFYWGSKDRRFDVYSEKIQPDCLSENLKFVRCYWLVKPDGFYLSSDRITFKKKIDWT
ncbi:hypothetical protein U1Q18_030842 [Sarracenia purpurea var. burkii]